MNANRNENGPVSRVETKVREFLRAQHDLLIDGEWTPALSGARFETHNPADGSVIAQVAEAGRADVDRAVVAARRAFEEGPWPDMKPAARARLIWKLADLLEENAEEFAWLES